MKNLEQPRIIKVSEVVKETPRIRTVFFDEKIESEPGQFFMIWLPGFDEKPFALSYTGKKPGITVELKGKFTRAMMTLKPGTEVGIRGPYGNSFKKDDTDLCIVAGGLGIAPMAPLVETFSNALVIQGAKKKTDLIFTDRFKKKNIHYSTDDGSFGARGFTTDVLKGALEKGGIKIVYTCGPEIMMRKVFELCEYKGVKCYASLERYMGCGIGVCASCACGDKLVCKDGPVFSSDQLCKMADFGRHALLKSGKKVQIKRFFEWRS